MRQSSMVFAALIALALGVPAANAGVTCKIVPSMCPSPPSGWEQGGHGNQSVPEPGTLGLLALGAGAAGLARLKQRLKKR